MADPGPAGLAAPGPARMADPGPAGAAGAGAGTAAGAGDDLPVTDLAEVSARFGAALREAGLPVGPGRCERFAAAVTVARPVTPRALYLCALTTLVSSKDQVLILRAIFEQVFGALGGENDAGSPGPPGDGDLGVLPESSPEHLLAAAAQAAREHAFDPRDSQTATADGEPGADEDTDEDPDAENRYLGTAAERLASKDFADLTEAELMSVAVLMRNLTLAVPERVSRRQRRRSGGRRIDMRATLRQARRTGGDAFRLIGRTPARRNRRLVVLCDISGSMEPYARAMLQLLYCAAGGASAEVFTFATRLTRLTPVLGRTLPGLALQRAGQTAPDWLGGTKIGAALKDFNDHYGRRGMARGAVVVIISDGWETGDPDLVRREMERLSLVAFRIVWVNPRTKSAGYQPLAGGMAAAWPHCDAVISGHTVHSLDQLTAALADPARRRAAVRLTETGRQPGR
ncbi:MAG: vWA domain-containing protein [Streptosporangiaceae bacterium]